MTKERLPSKGRIIIVTSCGSCPHHTIEEPDDKKSYIFCWAIMKQVIHLDKVHDDCPLEEIDFEWEEDVEDYDYGAGK